MTASTTRLAPEGYTNWYISEQGSRTLHLAKEGITVTLCDRDTATLNELKHPDDGLKYFNYPSRQCAICGQLYAAPNYTPRLL